MLDETRRNCCAKKEIRGSVIRSLGDVSMGSCVTPLVGEALWTDC